MIDLALRLNVFIASPSDVSTERDVTERVIEELKVEAARRRLLLQCFRWETRMPGYGAPQRGLNRVLRSAELTIVILWSKLGSIVAGSSETGSLQELRIAGELVSEGRSDDVFVYFRSLRNQGANGNNEQVERVKEFRRQLENANTLLFAEYEDPDAFGARLVDDLRQWLERWYGVPDACEYAVRRALPSEIPEEYLSDSRIDDIARVFNFETDPEKNSFLGNLAVSLYQLNGITSGAMRISNWPWPQDESYITRNSEAVDKTSIAGQVVPSKPLLLSSNGVFFSHSEWLFFFCALGVVTAILRRDLQAVSHRPYVNPVHQYLKYFSRSCKPQIAEVLRNWLRNADGSTTGKPVARNFAAYVLGMIGDIDAQDDLAQAIQDDPGRDVKLYAIASLGKLRARPQLPVLVEAFNQSSPQDVEIRDMAAQAICRMIGFLNFQM